MYLSRLQLNTQNRQVWRQIIGNPYKIHQMVMRGFPDGDKREAAKVLYRLEVDDAQAVLLVQSMFNPDWSAIDPAYLAPVSPFDLLGNPAVKMVELLLQAGQVFNFRLCANPSCKKIQRVENEDPDPGVKKIRHTKSGDFENSKRVALVKEVDQRAWLEKQAQAKGFTVLDATVSQPQKQIVWKNSAEKPITLYTVQFDGVLGVTDPDKLLEAVQTGIGSSKAFGCGLLSLAPLT